MDINDIIQEKFDIGELNEELVNNVVVDTLEYFYSRLADEDEQENLFYIVVLSSFVTHILYDAIVEEIDGVENLKKDDIDGAGVNILNAFVSVCAPMLRHSLATNIFKSEDEKKLMN